METLVVEAAPVNLRSDNVAGIAPEILAAIEAANAGTAPSYGADPITARLQDVFSELFETRCFVQPVATGTATNALALALIAPPYGAVYCTAVGHVHDSECGAGEFYTGGAKIVPLAEQHGRLHPETLRAALRKAGVGHTGRVQPAALNLTQATERGTVYRLDELDALVEVARTYGLRVHMDGARFANAIAALGCRPADVTWRRGVDVLSFGATKNGAMGAEAVVVFTEELAEPLRFRARRAGQVFSKMRFISAQLEAYVQGGLWLRLAGHANVMARRLADGIAGLPGVRLAHPVEINEIFAQMPRADDRRTARGRLRPVRSRRRRGAPGHRLQQHQRADRRVHRRGAPARLSGRADRRMGSERTVVAALCAAEVLAMAGTMSFQALIPTFIAEWRLSHSEVGWISGIAYAAYVAGVPVLVSLTDRIDARRIVIAFCLVAAVSSIGFAWFAQGLLERARFPGARRPGARRHLHARPQGADRPHRGAAQDPLPVLLYGELLGRLERVAVHDRRARRPLWLAARLRRGGRRAAARGAGAGTLGATGDAGAPS